jgi:hypothetical protein
VHIALGVRADGAKEVLGMWLEQNEGAKFWLRVMNELKNRGVEDILIAVVDGLKGFPDAINAVFPETTVQTCIVHLLRLSLDFVSYKDRKPIAAALKGIYRAVDATAAEGALSAFEQTPWGQKYPAIGQSWRRAWNEVIPFYAFPQEVRRILYTTNAIEALNSKLRRAVRARGHFPTDEAALKLLFLILNRCWKEWKMPRGWAWQRHSSLSCSASASPRPWQADVQPARPKHETPDSPDRPRNYGVPAQPWRWDGKGARRPRSPDRRLRRALQSSGLPREPRQHDPSRRPWQSRSHYPTARKDQAKDIQQRRLQQRKIAA